MPTADDTRRLFELERSLADRLRAAPAAERPALYRKVYDAYYTAVGPPAPDPAQAGLLAHLVSPFCSNDSTILEIGAGDGRLARHLAPRARKVIALEASEVVSADADDPPNLHWVSTREAADRITPASVDLAVSCHVVEHLHPDDLESHLGEVLGWLKPGGAYVVVTPNRLLGPHDISAAYSDVPLGFHLREYSFTDLSGALGRAGFRNIAALRGLGRPSRRAPLLPYRIAERLLDLLGPRARRRLLSMWDERRPLRPLEQVKIVGFRP